MTEESRYPLATATFRKMRMDYLNLIGRAPFQESQYLWELIEPDELGSSSAALESAEIICLDGRDHSHVDQLREEKSPVPDYTEFEVTIP
jgi:hypothetical protein